MSFPESFASRIPLTEPGYYPLFAPPRKRRIWLHLLLFLVTLLTTTAVGARMQFNFDHQLPVFEADRDIDAFWAWSRHPETLLAGLPFSLSLLLILMAHECGHYIACVYYGIDATLPFFLPAPTFTGTLGAFIRIRSPIYTRKQLFDIGVAGPLAGFLFLIPVLGIGLAFSKIVPGIGNAGSLHFGTPPLLAFVENIVFSGSPASDIYLHPVARAAWVGIFATALNLLPAGQLDGGHIVYALSSSHHTLITRITVAVLVPLGVFYWQGWLFWALVLFLLARRHPPVYDDTDAGPVRWRLGLLALLILLVSFTLAPVN